MEESGTGWGGCRLVSELVGKLRQGQRYAHTQPYLEELVQQESEPIGQHLLGHRLGPVTSHRGNRQGKTKTEAAGQTQGLGGQGRSAHGSIFKDCLVGHCPQHWESGCTTHWPHINPARGPICFTSSTRRIVGILSRVLGPGLRAKL